MIQCPLASYVHTYIKHTHLHATILKFLDIKQTFYSKKTQTNFLFYEKKIISQFSWFYERNGIDLTTIFYIHTFWYFYKKLLFLFEIEVDLKFYCYIVLQQFENLIILNS